MELLGGHPSHMMKIIETLMKIYPTNDIEKIRMAVVALKANIAIMETDMAFGYPIEIICNTIRDELECVEMFSNILHDQKIYKFDKCIDTHVELRELLLHNLEEYL